MKSQAIVILLASCGLIAACGCVPRNRAATQEPVSTADSQGLTAASGQQATPRVQEAWQKKMEDRLGADQITEGWAVFSSGGYADAGQIMVFSKGGDTLSLEFAKPTEKEVTVKRDLNADEAASIRRESATGDILVTLESQAFDGMQFEYVHMRLLNGKKVTVKRLFMNNPGNTKNGEKHAALVQAFQALRP